MNNVASLISLLKKYPETVFVTNQYQDLYKARNLAAYVDDICNSKLYSRDLLVGIAPGAGGCARTGIPFTDEHSIRNNQNQFLTGLRSKIIASGDKQEDTASIVWSVFESEKRIPAFWNIFPFHPHESNLQTNRNPTANERKQGEFFLSIVLGILKPKRVFAVGRIPDEAIKKHLPYLNAEYICHPARGRDNQTKFFSWNSQKQHLNISWLGIDQQRRAFR